MVTTRSRVKRAEAAAAASEVAPDTPALVPAKQRKRKNSNSSSPSSASPVPKLAKTDLALEELPRAPAPTPVTQLQQPAMETVAQPVDVTVAANAAAQDLAVMDPAPAQGPAPAVASEVTPRAVESELPQDDVTMTLASTEPTLKAPSTVTAPVAAARTSTEAPSVEATTADISTLESMKEPAPESKPLPGVATVLTQPAMATLTAAVPMTTMGFTNTTTPTAPTAPPLSSISAPAPAPAIFPTLSTGPAMPLTDASVLNNGLAPNLADTLTSTNSSADMPLPTEKPLSETLLETPTTIHSGSVNPTSLLLTPSTGMPDGTSTMAAVAVAPVPASAPASVVVVPTTTMTTGDTLQPQLHAPGSKAGAASDIAAVTNDIQPQAIPQQQQVNRSGNISSMMSGIDAATAAAMAAGSAHSKGPKQSGI